MAAGWSVLDALNKSSKAAVDETPKARFRTRDISIRKMYGNEKNFYSMPDIEKLAQEILAVGLLENLTVIYEPCDKGEYRIVAGERRWRALQMLVEHGHTEFEMATCQIKTATEAHEELVMMIVANAYRDKTVKDALEEERQLKESLLYMQQNGLTLAGYKLDSGRLRDVIADILQTSGTKVAQMESINKRLIPEFTQELTEGRLTFSAAYEISGMTTEGQQELLERYKETGSLTWKDVKEAKAAQAAAEAEKQIEGQMTYPDDYEEPEEEPEGAEEEEEAEEPEEWQQAHPESITSLCYGCQRYSDCNVKTSTCTSCDRYVDKAEAEKTAEQRYNEEQDAIDRETKKKLAEQERERKLDEHLKQSGRKIHDIKLGASFFDDAASGRKSFELRKNDRHYKVGDILRMMEFDDGRFTGRTTLKEVTYMLEDYTGLEDGYCIMATIPAAVAEEAGQEAGEDAGAGAAQPTLQYGA